MKLLQRITLLLIVIAAFTSPVAAQRRRGPAAKTPPPTAPKQTGPSFEDVLATDSYRIYVEIRGVGQLLKTPSFTDVIEPVMKLSGPPKEFKTLLSWLNLQADTLMTSRMLVASWSARPKLPNVLMAIEFASPEDAQKFEPKLRTFLPKVMPAASPASADSSPAGEKADDKRPQKSNETDETQSKSAPSFVVTQAGSLIYISDVNFTFKSLRPAGSKLLTEDPNFRRVHDRFATESVFVFVDTAGMQREDEERRKKYEEESAKEALAQPFPTPAEVEEVTNEIPETPQPDEAPPPAPVDPDAVREVETSRQTRVELGTANPAPPSIGSELIGGAANLLFSGPATLPDAVGLALAFEPETYSVRLLLANEPGVKGNPIPFMPQLVSGPPLALEAASVFPGDTEFFVSLSLDYQQIYEGMTKTLAERSVRMGMARVSANAPEETPFAVYERKSGIKLKEDLIPLLGNEVALMLPLQTLDLGPGKTAAEPPPGAIDGAAADRFSIVPSPNPVIAVALRDRDGMRALLPKLIDSFGVKGASLLGQTEKRGDTEIVSYGGALSYAFIGDFLVLSSSPKEVQRVADAYLNHDTLASETHFRNFTRWQPRQLLGQFYLSPKLMESYRDFTRTMDPSLADQFSSLLSRLSPTAEPLTYALSNEGLGPMHELRLPKNLAVLMLTTMFGASEPSSGNALNESAAQGKLQAIAHAEATFQSTNKEAGYGSIDQLVTAGLIAKEMLESSGYRIEVSVSGGSFTATAVPVEYGKTGKLSFFVDESKVLRGGDHGGGPATVADRPLQ
jgi:hypothetical protein